MFPRWEETSTITSATFCFRSCSLGHSGHIASAFSACTVPAQVLKSFAVNSSPATSCRYSFTSADVIANDCVTSLREAITYANSNPAPDVITFNIPGSGVHTIQPLSALPTITSPVTINGYSQPGSIQNTDTPSGGNNAVLQIELDGSLAGDVSGLVITAGNSTVRGLVINRFRHDGIQLQQGDGNVIEGNYIGTNPTGTVELGNGAGGSGLGSSGFPGAGGGGADYFGVLIGSRVYTSVSSYGSSVNRIGTNGDGASDAAERNLISGNDGGEIAIVGVGSDECRLHLRHLSDAPA